MSVDYLETALNTETGREALCDLGLLTVARHIVKNGDEEDVVVAVSEALLARLSQKYPTVF